MTTKYLVTTPRSTNNIYVLMPTGLEVFDPPLTAPETNMGSYAIWGAETGELIVCPRRTLGNENHFYHFEGVSWIDKGLTNQAVDIFGTSYDNVWACTGDFYQVRHWDGTTWATDAGPLGSSGITQIHACGPGLDEVFASAIGGCWFRTGGAYGSGTWVNRIAQMKSDTSITNLRVQGVFSVRKDKVFWLANYNNNTTQHWVIEWNGSNFSVISTPLTNNYSINQASFHGTSDSNMWWIQTDQSWGRFSFIYFDGTNIRRQEISGNPDGPSHNLWADATMELGDHSYTVGQRSINYAGNGIEVWRLSGSAWELYESVTLPSFQFAEPTGVSFWYGPSAIPPIIEDNSPTGTTNTLDPPISFSTKNVGGFGIVESTIRCTVEGVNAVVAGVIQPGWDGPGSGITANAFNGYDVVLQPTSILMPAEYTVYTECESDDGQTGTLTWNFTVELFVYTGTLSFIGIGVPPYPKSIENTASQTLLLEYSEIMMNDAALQRASSYVIEPQGGSSPIFVTAVSVEGVNPIFVTLTFVGEGTGWYRLVISGVMDIAGNYIDPNYIVFQIDNPAVDELFTETNMYFDTDMGAIRLGYNELSQRRVEDLAIIRAKNEGHLRQFSLISDELSRAGVDRNDRKLKLFKG